MTRSRVQVARESLALPDDVGWIGPLLLTVVWVAMASIAGPVGDFPLNDDWLFAMSARSVLEHFSFQVPSGSAPNVGPQAYWGALFCLFTGFSFTALRMSTLVLGLIGVLAFHRLFFRVWRSRPLALIAASMLLVNPIFFGLANTFMTDVPFLSCVIIALLLLVKGLDEDDGPARHLGLTVALAAVLIRHLALVVFVGFACAQIARGGRGLRNLCRAILPLALAIAVHIAFSVWLQRSGRKPLPWPMTDLTVTSVLTSLRPLIFESFTVLQYLGLFLLPLALFSFFRSARTDWRTPRRGHGRILAGLIVFDVLFVAYLFKNGAVMPSGGNILTAFGLGPLMLRDVSVLETNLPPLSPAIELFWIVMTALSTIGVNLIVLAVLTGAKRLHALYEVRRIGPWDDAERRAIVRVVFFATIGFCYLAIVLAIATRLPLFDRYLLPLVVLGALAVPVLGSNATAGRSALFGRRLTWSLATSALVLGGTAVFTVAATHDYMEWNRHRWSALGTLTARGIPPSRIDGGYEFDGWRLYDRRYEPHPSRSWWWVDDDEFVIASGPIPGYDVKGSLSFRRWFLGGDSAVLTLRRAGATASKERADGR